MEQHFSAMMSQHPGCQLGRVTSLDRGFPLVRAGGAELRAELATAIKKRSDSIVAVGDWVALAQPEGHEKAVIAEILPRENEIARVKRVGREKQIRRQVLAANVDAVVICHSLTGRGIDRTLLVRQIVAVYGCDARPVVVFTKADSVDTAEAQAELAFIREFDERIHAYAVSSATGEGLAFVQAECVPGSTTLLLGESGVGKSSLVNALTGRELQGVGRVRERDDRGRHTTVARRLIELPNGAAIIDAPGLRTLQILDLAHSLARAFPDVVENAACCKFANCTHTHEPGCAVVPNVAPQRLAAWFALQK